MILDKMDLEVLLNLQQNQNHGNPAGGSAESGITEKEGITIATSYY